MGTACLCSSHVKCKHISSLQSRGRQYPSITQRSTQLPCRGEADGSSIRFLIAKLIERCSFVSLESCFCKQAQSKAFSRLKKDLAKRRQSECDTSCWKCSPAKSSAGGHSHEPCYAPSPSSTHKNSATLDAAPCTVSQAGLPNDEAAWQRQCGMLCLLYVLPALPFASHTY